jgi:hypothetical protein
MIKVFSDFTLHKFYVGFEVLTAVVKESSIFWDITPCSPLKVNWSFRGTYRFHLQDRRISRARYQWESRWQAKLVSCSAYSSTLKMEALCSSETSVDFQRTTWHYTPKDNTLRKCFSNKTLHRVIYIIR